VGLAGAVVAALRERRPSTPATLVTGQQQTPGAPAG
jgi:hypothetical protein